MRMIRFLILALMAMTATAMSQVAIENFDSPKPDTSLWIAKEGATTVTLQVDQADKVEGSASMLVHTNIAAVHQWGTYTQFGYTLPDSVTPWDWSHSDSVSLWLKVRMAPSHPENMVLRIHIKDRPSLTDAGEEYLYENVTVLDQATSGWVNIRVPLYERTSTGTEIPDSTGFILAPSNWNMPTNNKQFDRTKIIGWSIAIVTTGWDAVNNLPADSIEVSFDRFERFGLRAVPVIIFNGLDFNAQISNRWAWGQSSMTVEKGAGTTPKANAIKWVQGNEWGNGWTGIGVDITPGFDIAGGWVKDSLKFKMKADTGVGPLRVQFESPATGGNKKVGKVFTPITDTLWHSYVMALRDMVPQDGTSGFDSSNVVVFGIMAEASGVAGKVIYITDIWTGDPTFDVIPPEAPTGLSAAGGGYINLLTWNDVPNEPGVKYNVYFADKAWTDPNDPTVEDLPPYNLPTAFATHSLRMPNTDQNVTYYYGVVAKDQAGNESGAAVMSQAVTTLAKGVPTVAKTAPAAFAADGDITEWAGVTPFALSTVTGTAHAAPNNPINGDADLSVKAYIAVDAQNLYVAFDVTDDVVAVDTGATDYLQDSPDLFIGLYDWRGKHHNGYGRGATPDYHFRFSKNRIRIDNDGGATVMYAFPDGVNKNPNYAWVEKVLEPGYVVEAKIPFAELAGMLVGKGDQVFSPVEGMRIPIDFSINDRDNGAQREGIMCYSPLNDDNSWQDMWHWSYTWIGNKSSTGVVQTDEAVRDYALSQNYPNPFNPTTQIRYSVAKAGMVSLKVYDLVGRELVTLVNQYQAAGSYSVTFSSAAFGTHLASGIYFYRLEAGSFVATNKMLLLK